MKSKVVIPCGLVLVFLLSTTMPIQFLEDVVYPKEVSSARETLTFDEVGTHETRKSLVGDEPVTLFQTGGEYTGDWLACKGLSLLYSDWDCTDKLPGWGTHTLEYDRYTFDAEVVYSYNIRHSGTVTFDITSTRQGNAAPEVEIEVVSSSDSYEVDVKASVEFTLKRTYIGPQGYNSDVRNTFTYTVPFPSLTDVDGDGSHKMLGDLKVFTWDNFADLSSLGTVQTSQLGSEENLSGTINLASIDLLELAGKYTSSNTLKAINFFVYVNFDVDLDIGFYLQAAAMPFIGTAGPTSLASNYELNSARLAYPCKLALTDALSTTPVLSTSCTRTLPQDSSDAHLQLGLWHDYRSEESYSVHLRVGAQSNVVAQKIWNLFTNQDYFEYTLASGLFSTNSRSQDTNLASSVVSFNVPAAQTIIPNTPPSAAMAVSPSTTTTGSTIYASTSSTYDQDGDAFTVQVFWGDGSQTNTSSTAGVVNHAYSSPGTYVVTLEVVDSKGATSSDRKTVIVSQAPSTLTSFLSANTTTITEGSSVNFTWGANGGTSSYTHRLNFGDGTNYSGSQSYATKTYNTAGQFGVQLQTSDGTEIITKSVQITVEPDYSSDGLDANNFEITGDQILVVIDDNDAELFPILGTHTEDDATHNPSSSRDALFESLSVMSEIRGVDWDLYYVGNASGYASDYNNESGPGLKFLEDYSTVIWTTGNHYYPFTDTDLDNLEIYTGAGGTLIVFSQDLIFGLCSYLQDSDCYETEYNSSHVLNQTFGLSEAEQDVGLGSTLYNMNGQGDGNVAYLPLAGLTLIETRGISGSENSSWSSDFADNVSTWVTNSGAIGHENAPVMNSSEGNHGLLNMENGTKTAFFAFDPVQFQHRADLENMMLSLSEWGEHSPDDKYKLENATYLPSGVDGAVLMGPWADELVSSNRTDELSHAFGLYTIQGHDYEFKIGQGLRSDGDTEIYYYDSTIESWESYLFYDYYWYCTDGPIADLSLYQADGTLVPISTSCDSSTGEISVEWTAPDSGKVFMVAESEDLESGNYWYYGTKVSFQEVAESWWTPISLSVNSSYTDVLHASDNTTNSEDYDTSLYELDVQAGTTYAVSVERPTGLNTQLMLYMSLLSNDDVYHYNDLELEYLYNGAERGSLVFTAINTTTVELYASVYNYSHALITDGQIELIAWELDANQPTDDYLNASDVAAGNSTGYVDFLTVFGDWWSQPVSAGDSYTVSVDFDSEDLFSIHAYFHPYDDPANWSFISEEIGYGDLQLELDQVGFGELRIAVVAQCENWHISGSRGNYSLEVVQAPSEAEMNEILFGVVGYDSSFDMISIDMVEDTDYVIRLNSTPQWLVGSFGGEQLDVEIITPSGLTYASTSYGSSDNRTIVYTASETGKHMIKVEGENGSYWVWPVEDLGPSFASSPQRYATAELPFNDTVEGDQWIISETFGYFLSTWMSYQLVTGPSGFSVDSVTGEISYLPGRSDVGQHPISIRVDNEWGKSEWQNYTLVVAALPNTAPVITSTGGGSATVGASYTTYVQATDVDNHSLTYSLSFGPVGATIDSQTGQLTWTPSTTGVSQFSVVVTDALGLSSSLTFNITSVNAAPAFVSKSNQTGTVGGLYSDSVTATDSDGHSMVYGLRYGPFGLSISPTGTLSWTPSASQVGDHLIVAEVNDAYGGSDILIYTITVPNTPATMTLGNIPSTLFPGDMFSLNSVLLDADGHEVWAVLQDGPLGTTMTANGTLLWTPLGSQIGSHSFELLVIDAWGEGELETFSIEVLNRNPSGEFSESISDPRLRTMHILYSAVDEDRQPIETLCVGQDLTVTELIAGEQLLIEWSVGQGAEANLVSCTTTDDYGGSHVEEVTLVFDELNRSSTFVGDNILTLGETGIGIWSIPFETDGLEIEVLVGNGVAGSVQTSEGWALEYVPDADVGPVVIHIQAANEHGDLISQIWQMVYQDDQLLLDIMDKGPIAFGTSVSATLSSTSHLVSLKSTILAGQGDVYTNPNGSLWDVTYDPNADDGKVLIEFTGVDAFGRTSSTIWSLVFIEEDLSWECTVGEFEQLVDVRMLEYSCSRDDVHVTAFTQQIAVPDVNLELQSIALSDLPYGQVVVYIQFTGPDDRVELVERSIFIEKPASTGSLTISNSSFITSDEETYFLKIVQGSSLTVELDVAHQGNEFVFCHLSPQDDVNLRNQRHPAFVSSDCIFSIKVGGPSFSISVDTYEIYLLNESDEILDKIVIEVLVEPADNEEEGFFSDLSPQSASLGAILGAILGVLGMLFILRGRGPAGPVLSQASKNREPDRRAGEIAPSTNAEEQKTLPQLDDSSEPQAPSGNNPPSASTPAQKTDEHGYEWYVTDNGINYYRTVGSGAEWLKFEN